MAQSGDRDLLVGIFAIQLGFIDATGFVAASRTWIHERGKPLVDVLVSSGWITEEDRSLLNRLVDRHIEQFGSVDQSLDKMTKHHPPSSLLTEISLEELKQVLPESWLDTIHRLETPATDVPQPESLEPTTERYRIVRDLARGGLGKVSVAHDDELDREVALKEIQRRHSGRHESQMRFLTEARITGSLEHPGVVPIYSLGNFSDGRPYYTMRLIKGKTLAARIKEDRISQLKGRAYEQAIRPLINHLIDVCNTIAYAHSRAVLHRDIKPTNIMLGKYGETLVVDWGLAKANESTGNDPMQSEMPLAELMESGSQPTEFGSVIGTPSYMSPEQANGRVDLIDARSDIFSLGATLYHILTGSAPYEGFSRDDIVDRARKWDLQPLRSLQPAVPRELNAICQKAMAKDRDDRYASAKDLAEDLERWTAGDSVAALPEGFATRILRWSRRHQTALASGFLMSFIGLAGMTYLYGKAMAAQQETAQALNDQRIQSLVTAHVIDQFVNEIADQVMTQDEKLDETRLAILRHVDELLDNNMNLAAEKTSLRLNKANVLLRLGNALKTAGVRESSQQTLEEARSCFREIASLAELVANENAHKPDSDLDIEECKVMDVNARAYLLEVEVAMLELSENTNPQSLRDALNSADRAMETAVRYFAGGKTESSAIGISRILNQRAVVLRIGKQLQESEECLKRSVLLLDGQLAKINETGFLVEREELILRDLLIYSVQSRVMLAQVCEMQKQMELMQQVLQQAKALNLRLRKIKSGGRDAEQFQNEIEALETQIRVPDIVR